MAQIIHECGMISGLLPGGSKTRIPVVRTLRAPVDLAFPTAFGQPRSLFAARRKNRMQRLCVRSLHDSGSENVEDNPSTRKDFSFKNGAWIQAQGVSGIEQSDSLWEQIGPAFRIAYAVGVYGAMALGGQAICHFIGIDGIGGFNMSAPVAMEGLGYAIPPMMALLFIHDDEVVKISLHARAIRDAEDEELMGFFVGLSPWQIMFVVSLAAVAEELFFRVAIQGGLTHAFLSDGKVKEHIDGIASLTGVFPSLPPFAHALAAVLTAALSGSILFMTSFPKDPKYVIAPVLRNQNSLRELKKSFAAWYKRRQLRRIYSPLLESMLALYLGFEWIQTGNILAPIITHVIYSTVIVGNGVWKIHDQRDRLRQRTSICEKTHHMSDYQSDKL